MSELFHLANTPQRLYAKREELPVIDNFDYICLLFYPGPH